MSAQNAEAALQRTNNVSGKSPVWRAEESQSRLCPASLMKSSVRQNRKANDSSCRHVKLPLPGLGNPGTEGANKTSGQRVAMIQCGLRTTRRIGETMSAIGYRSGRPERVSWERGRPVRKGVRQRASISRNTSCVGIYLVRRLFALARSRRTGRPRSQHETPVFSDGDSSSACSDGAEWRARKCSSTARQMSRSISVALCLNVRGRLS